MHVKVEIPPGLAVNTELRIPAAVLVRSAWLLLLSKYTGEEFLEFETSNSIDLQAYTALTIGLPHGRLVTELLTYVEDRLAGCTLHFSSTTIHALFAHEPIWMKTYNAHAISLRPQTGQENGCPTDVANGARGALDLEFSLGASDTSIEITHAHGTANPIQLDRFMQQLSGIILSLATCSTTSSLSEIDYMTSSDLQQLKSWNRSMPAPLDECVHLVASEKARKHPQKTAIEAPDGALTYAELEGFAIRLASRMVQLGVRRQSLVPLCFEKSKWNLVAMLATLKVGAAFVPIDPTCPDERARSIVRQSNAYFALASPKMASIFKPYVETIFEVSMQSFLSTNVEDNANVVPVASKPGDLAYAIFTSGTSGEPKGVLIEHRGICTSMRAANELVNIHNSSRVLQFASHAFDSSVEEMVSTLMYGATLCIPTEEDMGDIGAYIMREKITVAVMTPSFTRVLDPTSLQGLESLTFGGEAVATEDVIGRFDQVKRLNGVYGPSEASCVSAAVTFDGNLVAARNIGRPTGCIHWVVNPDDHSSLAPIGAVGELLIEGPIVGAGYLGDPEKTSKTFVQKPDWLQSMYPQRSERLYLTGDLVRHLPDGTLEYIGRKDTQVKLRGLRIELGEIESQLRHCLDELVDVAVDTVSSFDNRKLLVAFLLLAENSDGLDKGPGVLLTDGSVSRAGELAQSLKPQLAKQMPGYMIPEVFCLISQMPYTVSRKCDRRTLRAWASEDVLATYQGWPTIQSTDTITTRRESILKSAWLGVVSAQDVGRDSNFFHSGADSLTAIKLVSALRSQQWTLTVQDIFLYPKLGDMATVMSATQPFTMSKVSPFSLIENPKEVKIACALACNIAEAELEDIIPCTPFQAGVIAVSLQSPGSYFIQQCIAIPPTISDVNLAQAWQDISTHDYALRSRCVDTPDGLMQVILSAASSVSSKLRQIDGDLETYLKEDKSFTMTLGHPLARVCVVSDGTAKRTLVISMHHAVCDLWSVSQMLQRFRESLSGREYNIPSHPSLLASYIQDRDIDEALAFWRKQLANAPAIPFPIPPSECFQPMTNATLDHAFATRQTNESFLTPASYIRAAWALTVASYSGTRDVIFGTTVNGRTIPIPGIETMAGPAIATIPVRVVLPNKIQRTKEFVKEVQDGFAFTMPFEQIGLQSISRASSDAHAACKFQNLLVIDAEPAPETELSRYNCSLTFSNRLLIHHRRDQWHTFSTFMHANYALAVNIQLKNSEFVVKCSYDDRVMDAKQVKRVLRQFEHFHSQLSVGLDQLDLVNAHDVEELCHWNKPISEPWEACIHDLISIQAKQRPSAEAICAWDGSLTYRELEEFSTRLAGHLQYNLRVGPKSVVPYCFEKSVWSIVGMLAILKAGGAITALDPTWPRERAETIIDQAGAQIVLCSKSNELRLQGTGCTTLVVDDDLIGQLQNPQQPLGPTRAKDILFIQYTSGSTGRPKGILITHENWASSLAGHAERLCFDTNTRVIQFCNFTYDVSMGEIFSTLCKVRLKKQYDAMRRYLRSRRVVVCVFLQRVKDLTTSLEQSTGFEPTGCFRRPLWPPFYILKTFQE